MHALCNHCHKRHKRQRETKQRAINDTSSQWCNNFPIHPSTSVHASLSLSAIRLPAPARFTTACLSGEELLGRTKGLIEPGHHLMFISAQMKPSCPLNKPLAQTFRQHRLWPHDKFQYDITPSCVLPVSVCFPKNNSPPKFTVSTSFSMTSISHHIPVNDG